LDLYPDPIRIQGFNDQKLKKNTAEKKVNFFWIKNYNLPIPRPPLRTPKLQKKPSALKRGHPTLQNMNFKKNLSSFVGHFCPPGSRSGSTDPIESGSNPDMDPDPQPCRQVPLGFGVFIDIWSMEETYRTGTWEGWGGGDRTGDAAQSMT
jgi:hypothetical protein